MRMTFAALAVLAFGAMPDAAHADPYKWCAEYGSEGMGGSQNCYFMTEAQCRAQVSGIGGFCKPNPWYDGRPVGETPAGSPPRHKRSS